MLFRPSKIHFQQRWPGSTELVSKILHSVLITLLFLSSLILYLSIGPCLAHISINMPFSTSGNIRLHRWLNSKESTCNTRDAGSVPGLGRCPGERNGNPLQYSYLEDSMVRGTWLPSMDLERVGHDLVTK